MTAGTHKLQLYRIERKLTPPKLATRIDGDIRQFVCPEKVMCNGWCLNCAKTIEEIEN